MESKLNRTEIAELARKYGLGNIDRLSNRESLLSFIDGDIDDPDSPECPMSEHRETMENHITRNFRRLRTQLPNCNGKCTSFGCPELIVIRCWDAFKDDII